MSKSSELCIILWHKIAQNGSNIYEKCKRSPLHLGNVIKLAEEFVKDDDKFLWSAGASKAGETYNVCIQNAAEKKDIPISAILMCLGVGTLTVRIFM